MSDHAIAQLLQIEQQVRCCETATELGFILVNRTRDLVPYQQAVYLSGTELESLKVTAISDIALVDRTTPFSAWLEQVSAVVSASEQANTAHTIETKNLPAALLSDLNDFTSPYMLWLPLLIPSKPNQRVGVLWLAKSQPWTEKEIGLLQHLASSYAHALQVFVQHSGWQAWRRRLFSKRISLAVLATAILLGFVPVRLTVLAPAEIIAKDALLVTSAIAGAVREVSVKPGDLVSMGQSIVVMDKTEFQGRFDVAQRELERAMAELRTTEQAGYVDRRKKAELAELESQVALKTIERNYLQTKLDQTQILADKAGMVVLDDPEKWKGRPVVVGERILSIADPTKVQLEIMLPVTDAISLNHGDEVTLFLDTDPLNPIPFLVNYSSFEPSLTPDQIIAYRIVADIQGEAMPPRIGLRGTAKLYGDEVSLAYYLFRRPVTFVRQYLGV
ncbi:HlyD family efflux transporter periplasmic adaptor subunit [Marinomonas sp. M1K-6]|uniref:HlyD family efflux transporter periplasmic adaptor subunit n=1 Tax=Marinomonas profundi TaxID=2726122 RepID=A0A847R763_9GAMM|nr:HlyD family efflux transporter periplasmic adaptor subunit [Marinomonas profundi]NLQ17936.1 HlyD family efflux transporter periplasmic adaptor subunit [Marinomonas profundi]UDV03410.1 HlyD family efflux transporter periplasmic adaptor subunit [Marinomonas profundi]